MSRMYLLLNVRNIGSEAGWLQGRHMFSTFCRAICAWTDVHSQWKLAPMMLCEA